LITTLGEWTTQNKTRQQRAFFHHEQQTLWLLREGRWHQHQLIAKHRTFWIFNPEITSLRQQAPTQVVPIDIIECTDNQIRTSPALRQRQDQTGLQTITIPWYRKPFQSFQLLTGQISLLIDPEDIHSLFQNKAHIEIASDGGHEPTTGISTYGWTAAANKILIAKGRGPAQAHPSMAESFCSEGYGLSSALVFIDKI
jgi:hypothetical protein